MTTEQVEQQTEQGPPEINTPEPPVGDQPVQMSTEEQAPEQPPEPTPINEAASMPPTSAPAPQEGQQAPPPPAPQYTPEQIAKMQQEAAQYEQIQVRAALQNQTDQYKRQLELQGYMPEQAEHAANTYMQSEQQRMDLMKQANEYGQHIQGRQLAAEFLAKKHNLGLGDLEVLRQYDDPQSMEKAAQTLSANRERDAELARLKQAQVPAQTFDNSQGNPQVAADEGGWLDRYNGGDRSPSAQAAARRAAGLS
jgi:hypothetical protein